MNLILLNHLKVILNRPLFTLSGDKAYDNYAAEEKLLDKLVNDWGVFINHGYFVRDRIGYEDGTWTDNNGEIKINPYFDKVLEFMAHMRDEGDLCITTVRDLLDYWTLIENISFEYRPDGKIYVYNSNGETVKGLSMAVHADKIRLNNQIPRFKREGEDIIFWFDIPARDHVILQVN
jgi:hypothetical protein